MRIIDQTLGRVCPRPGAGLPDPGDLLHDRPVARRPRLGAGARPVDRRSGDHPGPRRRRSASPCRWRSPALQFGTWTAVLVVVGIFLFGQTVEANILTPKLVGDRVHLHPVWVIFALLAGGRLLGLAGVFVSVPAAAVLGVLVRFASRTLSRAARSTIRTGAPVGAGAARAMIQLTFHAGRRGGVRARGFLSSPTAMPRRSPGSIAGPTGRRRRCCCTARRARGKTHLAHLWCARAPAALVSARRAGRGRACAGCSIGGRSPDRGRRRRSRRAKAACCTCSTPAAKAAAACC